MTTKKSRAVKLDNRKFHREIDNLNDSLRGNGGDDLRHLDDIPNFTGPDEPIPFPYGSGKGKDFGLWVGHKWPR